MNSIEFDKHLEILGLTQGSAAALLQVDPRSVRRWQNGDQAIPEMVGTLLQAWRQLEARKIPWGADLESRWYGDDDQIHRHQDHDLALNEILCRVEKRGGPAAPWHVSLEEHSASLGPMTVHFYQLKSGSFSLANYRRSDKAPNIQRDWPLIEDAVAEYAAALGKNSTANVAYRGFEIGVFKDPSGRWTANMGSNVPRNFNLLSGRIEILTAINREKLLEKAKKFIDELVGN